MKTQVAIIGAGPAGLFLGHVLHLHGIDFVILEAKSRAYCEARIRAGILEQGTVDLLRQSGLGERLDREAMPHEGINIAFQGELHLIDIEKYTDGKRVFAYGQTEITKDAFKKHEENGTLLLTEAEVTALDNLEGDRAAVRYRHEGQDKTLECDFIAGCDGFHGVCRPSIPQQARTGFELAYPYSWLGVLASAPPASHVVVYAQSDHGFGLQSMRSPEISRLYVQVENDDTVDNWPDERFWDEIDLRTGVKQNRGPITQRGITEMRSFVSEPMRYGRLFLAGDAAHIVPPTGAKGLNLAISDTAVLARALIDFIKKGDEEGLKLYSETALRRVWRSERFSWFCTTLWHRDTRHNPFEQQLQRVNLEYLLSSDAAKASFSENYAGLPIERVPEF